MASASGFVPPKKEEQLKALGENPTKEYLHWEGDFEDCPVPKSGDWLFGRREQKQPFSKFESAPKNIPDGKRNVIYVVPVGSFDQGKSPALDKIVQYVSLFYNMPTRVLSPLDPLHSSAFRTRKHQGKLQFYTKDITNYLKKTLPNDAFCTVAISMTDLYPDPSWNFVFGEASLIDRVGIFSFARFDPSFYGESRTPEQEKLLLKRSLKVVVHEIGHMFGMHHCLYFNCLMRGSNHLQEADSRPVHLCPICLRKAQSSCAFDIKEHYQKMLQFYEDNNFPKEAEWFRKRLATIA
jgi:archaemetzincin